MSKLTIKNKFTVIPNDLLNDAKISLKAKGLYAYLNSKPDGWRFSKKRMAEALKEGVTSLLSALKELKENGWLEMRLLKDENNKFNGYDYIIYGFKKNKKCSDSIVHVSNTPENHYSFNNIDNNKKDMKNYCNKLAKTEKTKIKPALKNQVGTLYGYPVIKTTKIENENENIKKSKENDKQTQEIINKFIENEEEDIKISKENNKLIGEIMSKFIKINPGLKFGNLTERDSVLRVDDLLKTIAPNLPIGELVDECIRRQGEQYCPVITKPTQLERKLTEFLIYLKKEMSNKKGGINILK